MTKEKIMTKQELQKKLEQAEAEIKDIRSELDKLDKKSVVWKPKRGEYYYYIDDYGSEFQRTYWYDCGSEFQRTYWYDYGSDLGRYAIGNCYPTKEAAELAAETQKAETKLRRFIAEINDGVEVDWSDRDQPKGYFYYDYKIGQIGFAAAWYCQTLPTERYVVPVDFSDMDKHVKSLKSHMTPRELYLVGLWKEVK